MRNRNRSVRNNTQAIVESIMAKIRPIVEGQFNMEKPINIPSDRFTIYELAKVINPKNAVHGLVILESVLATCQRLGIIDGYDADKLDEEFDNSEY